MTTLQRWWVLARPSLRYLFSIESHVYAFSMAANVLLSFFPFMVLILSLTHNVLRWRGAADVIYVALRDSLPQDPGLVEFVVRNLHVAVQSRGRVEALSVVMLLFSSNGIFVPLEVALNRLWRFEKDRSYWLNQLMSFGLTLFCGSLALGAVLIASWCAGAVGGLLGGSPTLVYLVILAVVRLAAVPSAIVMVFVVLWILPNGRVPFRRVLPAAAVTGIVLEAARNAYVLLWPLLGFRRAYGPFFISVTLLMWGYLASMIVLAGAELSARQHGCDALRSAPHVGQRDVPE